MEGAAHTVIIIPGLGRDEGNIERATRHWEKYGLCPVVHAVGWHDDEKTFQPKLRRLVRLVDSLKKKGNIVSIVGLSAGGSAALNAFVGRKKSVHRVVSICARLRVGTEKGFRSFQTRTASSPAFADSIRRFARREKTLTVIDRRRIMTVRPMFGDELVPADTVALGHANNIVVPTAEHVLSIALALTVFSGPILTFLRER